MPDYTIKHGGKTYTVRANSPEEAAAAFDTEAAPSRPSVASGMQQAPSALNVRGMDEGQQRQMGVIPVARNDADLAQQRQQGQRGAQSMLSGIAEGGNLLKEGMQQLGGGIQDSWNMLFRGKPIRKDEPIRNAEGKVIARDREQLDSSKEAQVTAQAMLDQAIRQQEAIDSGVNIPDRNFSAGATQLGTLAIAPELATPKATTLIGGMIKNSASGAAGGGAIFNADEGQKDSLLGAAAAPVLGLPMSIAPAVKNYIARGFSRIMGKGRSAGTADRMAEVLPRTAKTITLAQRTGIPEMVTLERAAYNSDMVNTYADQTDTFVKEFTDVLRQPMKNGQTLSNDFVSARTGAETALRNMKRAANDGYTAGIQRARVRAAEDNPTARIPVSRFTQEADAVMAEAEGLFKRGHPAPMNRRAIASLRGVLHKDGMDGIVNVNELADTMVDVTRMQTSDDPAVRALGARMRAALDDDLDNLEGNATFAADDATKEILETRAEYKRSRRLIDELSNSAAHKLLGVSDPALFDETEVLNTFKGFTPDKQASVRTFLEANSPDMLVSLKDAAIRDMQQKASTIRAAADSQQDLTLLMDSMFDAKNGSMLRSHGLWSADEIKKFEGIKEGLRSIANHRPNVAGAGTPVKPEDIAINLVSRSGIFGARQAARVMMGTKAHDFFTDPKVYAMLTKIDRTTTGSPANLAARAAFLDYMQTDYAEQEEAKQ